MDATTEQCPAGLHSPPGNMTTIDGQVRCYQCFLERIHHGVERQEDPLAGFRPSPFGRIDGFAA